VICDKKAPISALRLAVVGIVDFDEAEISVPTPAW